MKRLEKNNILNNQEKNGKRKRKNYQRDQKKLNQDFKR